MIYLDHAAATPVHSKALAAMLPYFDQEFFNPSAPYLPAKRAREAYESAKDQLAHVIGAKGVDLVVTSGATESINLAFTVTRGQVLTLATEHSAVLAAAKQHSYELINVDRNGLILLDDLRQKLTDDVELLSISLANNELGTIQPLPEISELVRQTRQDRLRRGIKTPLYLHSDASQALSLLDLNVSRLGVDLLTINAAKCGGPKGVGALYVGHGVKLTPINVGGGQERGLRSGTENVPGVIGFAVAATEAKQHLNGNRKKYQEMVSILRQELSKIGAESAHKSTHSPTKTPDPESNSAPYTSIVAQNVENVKHKPYNPGHLEPDSEPALHLKSISNPHELNSESTLNLKSTSGSTSNSTSNPILAPIFLGNPKHQLTNFCPICFPGIDAERLIYRLEQREIYLSTGAACAANKGTKSHVLAAIGLTDAEIAGSLRISLGSTNDLDQIKQAAQIIREEVEREYERISR